MPKDATLPLGGDGHAMAQLVHRMVGAHITKPADVIETVDALLNDLGPVGGRTWRFGVWKLLLSLVSKNTSPALRTKLQHGSQMTPSISRRSRM